MKHKPPEKHPRSKHAAALHGLKSAGPSAPMSKQPPPKDPTRILRDALKAKEVEALAKQVATDYS